MQFFTRKESGKLNSIYFDKKNRKIWKRKELREKKTLVKSSPNQIKKKWHKMSSHDLMKSTKKMNARLDHVLEGYQ